MGFECLFDYLSWVKVDFKMKDDRANDELLSMSFSLKIQAFHSTHRVLDAGKYGNVAFTLSQRLSRTFYPQFSDPTITTVTKPGIQMSLARN